MGRRWPLVALALWSLLVWGTRVNNIIADDALSAGGKVGRVALALSFVLVGVVVGLVWWRARGRALDEVELRLLHGAVIWTIVVWVVRAVGIAAADHDVAFVVVHLVLAVVSIALGLLAWRAGTLGPHGPARHRPAEADATS